MSEARKDVKKMKVDDFVIKKLDEIDNSVYCHKCGGKLIPRLVKRNYCRKCGEERHAIEFSCPEFSMSMKGQQHDKIVLTYNSNPDLEFVYCSECDCCLKFVSFICPGSIVKPKKHDGRLVITF